MFRHFQIGPKMWKCQPITVVGSRFFFLSTKKGFNSVDILYKNYTHQKSENNINGLKSKFNSLGSKIGQNPCFNSVDNLHRQVNKKKGLKKRK